jgi:hypothetical protein
MVPRKFSRSSVKGLKCSFESLKQPTKQPLRIISERDKRHVMLWARRRHGARDKTHLTQQI